MDSKRVLPPKVSCTIILRHSSSHSDSIPVFKDGSKSEAEVGFSVVFPSFRRGCSLPNIASVFTTELSAIFFALHIVFTFPEASYFF